MLPTQSDTLRNTIVISSDDETEAPPAKRQKTIPTAPLVVQRPHPVARPKRRPFLIDLTACDDLIDDATEEPPKKRFKKKSRLAKNNTNDSPILIHDTDDEQGGDDSDSDYDNIHEGYAVGWSTSAIEPDEHIFDVDVDFVAESVARLRLDRVDLRIVHNSRKLAPLYAAEATSSHPNVEFRYMGSSSFRRSLPSQKHGPIHKAYCGWRLRTGILRHCPPQLQSPFRHLRLLSRFRMADASQCISQCSSKILVASSTPGGTMEDDDNLRVDPYNSRNTLALWTEDKHERWIRAHCVLSPRRKYYDIKCARFDPTSSNIFVSTGRDGTLVVWKYMKPNPTKFQNSVSDYFDPFFHDDIQARYVPLRQWGKETHQGFCHDLVYKPQDSPDELVVFAAPCDNGSVFLHSYGQETGVTSPVHQLRVSPRSSQTGAVVWGQRSTSNQLFACSEADNAFHGAFDVVTEKCLYYFDQNQSGEELVLDPEGNSLALFTVKGDLYMHLYDVLRRDKRSTLSITLPPPSPQLPVDTAPEVSCASWSPDGLLLAVGCNDDVVHIYDVRNAQRGPFQTLVHETRSSSRDVPLVSLPEGERMESKSYGITVLSWTSESFKSPRIGLLTGGGDPLWDIKTACQERHVVAELDGHVGVAHFGDLSRGEKPLVAGDTDGHVYIYDFVERSI